MIVEPLEGILASPAAEPVTGWRRVLRHGEDLLVVLSLAALMALPLIETILRRFHSGISGSSAFVQNFTLIVGMLGRVKAAARVLSSGVAAVISAFLCVASVQFLLTEKKAGARLAYNIPTWIVELVLPIGFGLIALRLTWHAAKHWKGRTIALLLASAISLLFMHSPVPQEKLVVPALVALLIATFLGAPVFTAIGGAALILFWGEQSPIATIPLKHHSLVTNPSLPTIPRFTLAGYFLAEGGASKRHVRVFQTLVGSLPGGPAIVTALVCAF